MPEPLVQRSRPSDSSAARGFALWSIGFRPFYLLASAFSALSVLLWATQFSGVLPSAYLQGPLWHAHEMLFGFTLAVIAGFLLTAVRNWTGQSTPSGMPLMALAALWVAGRVLVLAPYPEAAAAVNAAFPIALAVAIGIPLVRSRNTRNYFFLGLLGTFWGLIDTVGSVGKVIESLRVGGDPAAMFDSLKEGLAAPLGGMGISFSSSLFGLAGSLVLGFLDLQSSQAQNRFYTELEDWLSTTVYDQAAEPTVAASVTGEVRSAIERLREAVDQAGAGKSASAAMANLAEAIQGLVHHMRTEQQMIRDWVDSQAEQQREIKKLLELMVREKVNR